MTKYPVPCKNYFPYEILKEEGMDRTMHLCIHDKAQPKNINRV